MCIGTRSCLCASWCTFRRVVCVPPCVFCTSQQLTHRVDSVGHVERIVVTSAKRSHDCGFDRATNHQTGHTDREEWYSRWKSWIEKFATHAGCTCRNNKTLLKKQQTAGGDQCRATETMSLIYTTQITHKGCLAIPNCWNSFNGNWKYLHYYYYCY